MRRFLRIWDTAQLMGINVDHTISFTFGLVSGLAAIAAVLILLLSNRAYDGLDAGLKGICCRSTRWYRLNIRSGTRRLCYRHCRKPYKGYISSALPTIVFGILIVVLIIKPSEFSDGPKRESVRL